MLPFLAPAARRAPAHMACRTLKAWYPLCVFFIPLGQVQGRGGFFPRGRPPQPTRSWFSRRRFRGWPMSPQCFGFLTQKAVHVSSGKHTA